MGAIAARQGHQHAGGMADNVPRGTKQQAAKSLEPSKSPPSARTTEWLREFHVELFLFS